MCSIDLNVHYLHAVSYGSKISLDLKANFGALYDSVQISDFQAEKIHVTFYDFLTVVVSGTFVRKIFFWMGGGRIPGGMQPPENRDENPPYPPPLTRQPRGIVRYIR